MYATMIPGKITDIDSSAKLATGTRYIDENGKEYIYAKGVASTATGDWVKLSLSSGELITTRLTETAGALGGMIGVAKAAIVANKYGWYQVYGIASGSFLVSCATNVTLFCTATDGSLDDAGTTRVHGVWLQDTEPGTGTAVLTCFLSYPHCNKVA